MDLVRIMFGSAPALQAFINWTSFEELWSGLKSLGGFYWLRVLIDGVKDMAASKEDTSRRPGAAGVGKTDTLRVSQYQQQTDITVKQHTHSLSIILAAFAKLSFLFADSFPWFWVANLERKWLGNAANPHLIYDVINT